VLVQPEMERGRSPLVSIPPRGRGFSRHRGLPIRSGFFEERRRDASTPRSSSRWAHQAIPRRGCVPAEPASVSPGKS